MYVAGRTPRSERAVNSMRRLCEIHLHGTYELVVVDVVEDPAAAEADDVIVTPTVIVREPGPERRIVGDLSDVDRVLAALDLVAEDASQGVGSVVSEPPGLA